MQRVNQAYARGDLLDLLTAQVEIEQIDAEHLAQATDQRLAEYSSVLRSQRQALRDKLAHWQLPLRLHFEGRLATRALRPTLFDRLIDDERGAIQTPLTTLRQDIDALRDPARRTAAIDAIAHAAAHDRDLEALTELLASMAMPAQSSHPPKQNRKSTGTPCR